jgi:hypothetical protein
MNAVLRPAETELQSLDIVLPLKVGARPHSSDLDRFSLLLLPSFARNFSDVSVLNFTLIVPQADMELVARHEALHRGFNLTVLCEDELCPDLHNVPGRGWFRQQVLKLAAARLSGSQYYLVLDADVILKRPCSLRDWFPNGKPYLQRESARDHWDWWMASSRLLDSSVKLRERLQVIGVTPQFLHRETCLELHHAIASRNATTSWERFLMSSTDIPWSEYTLYWLYVMERKLERELYEDASFDRPLSEGIWTRAQLNFWSLHWLLRSKAWFLVVQSNLGLDPQRVRKRVRRLLE